MTSQELSGAQGKEEEVIDCHNHVGVDPYFYLHGDYPYAQDLPAMMENAGAAGITRWVVFPFVTNLSFDLSPMRKGELVFSGEQTPYAFENRRLLTEVTEYFPEYSERVIPFAMVDPLRMPEEQVKELRVLRGEYPICGLKIQATIIQSPIKSLLKEGTGFLDLAREWDVPFIIHSSVAENDVWSQASDILDVVEQNPDIRFCVAHSCRFDQPCLDRLATLSNAWFDCSAHRIHCESVIRGLPNVAPEERRLPGDYSDPTEILSTMYRRYPDKLLWGSDSPFYSWITKTGRFPFALKTRYALETECLWALPEAARKAISSANTRRYLYGK